MLGKVSIVALFSGLNGFFKSCWDSPFELSLLPFSDDFSWEALASVLSFSKNPKSGRDVNGCGDSLAVTGGSGRTNV